jgi:hypothetical protein
LDQDWAAITGVSWPHGATIPLPQALTLLTSLKCKLSRSLSPDLVTALPQVVQVWFEPPPQAPVTTAPNPVRMPSPILTFDGKIQLTPQTLSWTTSLDPVALRQTMGGGGRVLIRIHAGTLYDAQKKAFSATLDQILGTTSLRLPGGVFESWFFVSAG